MSDTVASDVRAPLKMRSLSAYWRQHPLRGLATIAAVVTALRVVLLIVSPAELGVDEVQYWVWSRTLDWGYFSKPPLIAWAIAATTGAFGSSEWAVRLSAPLFHGGAAIFLALTGARLYGTRVGFWSGLGWLTLPSVALSSFVISTDAPLLFFWSAALYFFFRATASSHDEGRTTRQRYQDAIWLGVAIGFGLLAKYAMLYFAPGAALAILATKDLRHGQLRGPLVAALLVALAILAPNLVWNADHGFETVSHTAANADWKEAKFSLANFLAFCAGQAGIFGPVLLALLVWGVANGKMRGREAGADRALLAFSLPPLLIIAAQAFVARAHANWAAAAYPSALIVVTHWAFAARLGRLIAASAALCAAAALGFSATLANFTFADTLHLSAAVKRLRGWAPLAADIRAAAAGYDAVLVDDRETMSALLYYARGTSALPGPRIVALNSNNTANNHYESAMRYDPARDRHVLFVSKFADARGATQYYARVALRGEASAPLGRSDPRTIYWFDAEGPSRR